MSETLETVRHFNVHTTEENMHGRRSVKTQRGVDAARLISIMKDVLDEAGLLNNKDLDDIANVLFSFEPTLPKEAQEELRHG